MRRALFTLAVALLMTACGEERPSPSPSPFRLADGVRVADPSGVTEGYDVRVRPDGSSQFTVNVSAERLATVAKRLFEGVGVPGYFVIETGSDQPTEEELRRRADDPFHVDVFYLDGIGVERAAAILATYERILIHDGGVNFGFGSHAGKGEVLVGSYKIVTVFTPDPERFHSMLKELGFARRETLRTVWDTFTREAPGERVALEDARPTRAEMMEQLKQQGLYFAERREE